MYRTNQIGWGITGVSFVVIVLLIFAFVQGERDRQEACAFACDATGVDQCGMVSCPYQEWNIIGYVVWAVGLLVAGLGGAGIYLTTGKEKIIKEKVYDLSKLKDEEQRAFLIVKKAKEGIYQSALAKELGVSKVRMTRILDSLEQHHLIERKRRGMTNVIVVK